MKLTKSKLKEIIREEIQMLNEGKYEAEWKKLFRSPEGKKNWIDLNILHSVSGLSKKEKEVLAKKLGYNKLLKKYNIELENN